jgi:hypothetical protein
MLPSLWKNFSRGCVMPVLGIVTCEILELEWAHLLSSDPDIDAVTVVDDDFSKGFIDAIVPAASYRFNRIPSLETFLEPSLKKERWKFYSKHGKPQKSLLAVFQKILFRSIKLR